MKTSEEIYQRFYTFLITKYEFMIDRRKKESNGWKNNKSDTMQRKLMPKETSDG